MTTRSFPNVLFVADKLGYPGGVSYGITTYCLHVLPALAKAGVPMTACFLREPHPAAEALEEFGIRPVFLSASRFDPTAVRLLLRLARQQRCEVLHAAGYASTIMARLVARMLPARTIVHAHDLHWPGPLVRGLEALLSRDTDAAVCVSNAARDNTAGVYRVSPERVKVIHNGIDLERFRDVPDDARERVRREFGIPAHVPVIGIVARIYAVKGHRGMIRMMPDILHGCPGTRLLIVGDGPEREACEALVDELGMREAVIFTGQREDVAEILSACDLFAMPSDTEGYPTSAIEALAMATPVVGYDVGGVGEVVENGVTGRLVPHGDVDAFVSSVVSLLKDPAALAEMGRSARRTAERFRVEHHVRQLLALYRDVGRPAGPALSSTTLQGAGSQEESGLRRRL